MSVEQTKERGKEVNSLPRGFLSCSGFTLVEIMFVVLIIAVLAAISIPNLLKTRMKTNEAAAKAVVQTIAAAEISYHSEFNTFGSLENLVGASYMKEDLETDKTLKKHGYIFFVYNNDANDFCATAKPETFNRTGELAFCITDSGALRFKKCSSAPCAITSLSECGPGLNKVP